MKKMFNDIMNVENIGLDTMKHMVFGLTKDQAHTWLRTKLDITIREWNKMADFIELHCIDNEIIFT